MHRSTLQGRGSFTAFELKGDPAQGRKLFLDRNRGPCTGCHLVQGADVWPAGNVGADLSLAGERYANADAVIYQ